MTALEKMRLLRPTFLFLLIFACKEKQTEIIPESKIENKESESITLQPETQMETDSIYQLYQKGKVEKYDWDIVFNKEANYKEISEPYSEKSLVPNDFLEFSQQFISDPNFQKSHIEFDNLIAVVGDCDETFVLGDNNWVFYDWDFIKEIGVNEEWENTFHYSDYIFFAEYKLKEVGTITMLGFEKIEDEWYLTLLFQNDC